MQQGFLGAGVAAVGFAVTQSIAGSSGGGINLPAVSAPKISAPKISAPKIGGGGPKAVIGAPRSFIKDPKGKIILLCICMCHYTVFGCFLLTSCLS